MKGTWQTTDSGGNGTGRAALVVLAVIVLAVIARPVAAAAAELVRLVLITAAVILGLALAAVAAFAACRVRQGRRSAPFTVRQVPPVTRQAAEPLPAPRRPAIERPAELHLHFHGVTADEVAEIIRDRQEPS